MDFDNIDVNLDTDIHNVNARKKMRASHEGGRYVDDIDDEARAISNDEYELDEELPINSDINDQIEDEDVDIPIDDEEGDSGVKDSSNVNSNKHQRQDHSDVISDNYEGFAGEDKDISESVKDEISE